MAKKYRRIRRASDCEGNPIFIYLQKIFLFTFLFLQMEKEGFIGYECLPPLSDTHLGIQELRGLIRVSETADYSRKSFNQLRFNRVFALKPIDGGVQVFCCHSSILHGPDRDQAGFPHICDAACNTAVLIGRVSFLIFLIFGIFSITDYFLE